MIILRNKLYSRDIFLRKAVNNSTANKIKQGVLSPEEAKERIAAVRSIAKDYRDSGKKLHCVDIGLGLGLNHNATGSRFNHRKYNYKS